MAKASSIGNVGLVSTQLKRTVVMKYTVWDDFGLVEERDSYSCPYCNYAGGC
jgi:hypothetical protein